MRTKIDYERKTSEGAVIFVCTKTRFVQIGLGMKGDIWLIIIFYILSSIAFGMVAYYGDFPVILPIVLFLIPVIFGVPIILGDFLLERHPRSSSNRTILTFFSNQRLLKVEKGSLERGGTEFVGNKYKIKEYPFEKIKIDSTHYNVVIDVGWDAVEVFHSSDERKVIEVRRQIEDLLYSR